MDTRKAQLGKRWRALTPEHQYQLERILGGGDGYEDADEVGTFTQFQRGETVDPLALVGAYRSGKTQLLYYLFDEAWKRQMPAFYVGDPGSMLERFDESDLDELDEWIEHRIDEQLEAYRDGDPEGVEWFPNVDSQTKQEYVDEYGELVPDDGMIQTAVLFDEVEQSYRNFIKSMDKDDDNPLRKINDNLQDTVKVWSFGMISAFEFIGEADWGRMREIRIPPLTVADVRSLLQDERPDATELANVIWWLARGRTGLIIKLIDELPREIDEDATEWLKNQAEADFKDTRLVNNLWGELNREQWDPAINALLFRDDGLDDWQINDEISLNLDTCLTIAINVIKDVHDFPNTDTGNDARSVLDRNVKRVFQALAVGEEPLFPRFGLTQEKQANAFLDLVENTVVSFEPSGPTRRLVIDALNNAEDSFGTGWLQQATDADAVDTAVTTADPVKIRDAFPPIAVNPERVAAAGSDDIRGDMELGLEFKTNTPVDDIITVRFCPTKSAATAQISEVVHGYDITDPTLLIIPDEDQFELPPNDDADIYERQNLLKIRRIQSNRMWSFVLNVHARLDTEGLNPYSVDESVKAELLEYIEDREVRNTVETLYEQLNQVAKDEAKDFETEYRDTYSLPQSDTLLWNEERLSGSTPYWSNGRFEEATIALSYLPVFGPEYEHNREYATLHQHLEESINRSLVSGGSSGFGFTEYFDEMFSQAGYSNKVETERSHYRDDGNLSPAVVQVEKTLAEFANIRGPTKVASALDESSNDASAGDIPAISISDVEEQAYPLFRSLLVCGMTKASNPHLDVVARLRQMKTHLESHLSTVSGYIEDVETLDSELHLPERLDDVSPIEINHNRIDQYRSNLEKIISATEDLIEKCDTTPSAGPIGYHYLFLLREYRDDIGDQIHAFESSILAAETTQIQNGRIIFNDLCDNIEHSDAIPRQFESRQDLLDKLEDFGQEIFDLESHHGATAMSIPEDTEALQELNETVGKYNEILNEIQTDLNEIERLTSELEPQFVECKEIIEQLLKPDEEVPADD